MAPQDTYVGDEARSKRGMLNLKYPIEHGVVTNWDDMEELWSHVFYNELRITPEEYSSVVMTTPAEVSKEQLEKTTEVIKKYSS